MRSVLRALALTVPLPLLLGAGLLSRQDDPVKAAETYAHDIQPAVARYCAPCHTGKDARAGVRLDGAADLAALEKDTTTWRRAVKAIHDGSMPPQGVPRPSQALREKLTLFLTERLERADASAAPRDPGRVSPRRLNRLEYNNTIRDLFGVDTHPADTFPADGGGGGGFDNNADTLFLPPVLMERYLEAAGEILDAADPKRLFIAAPGPNRPPRAAARTIVSHWATLAFRRPVRPDELARLLKIYDGAVAQKVSHNDAVKRTLKAVLVSPNFLFRTEADSGNAGPHPLDDYEIASRLSYFLWSSAPDEALRDLAAQKRLSQPKVLDAQVARMLESPKAAAFAQSFAGQWLRAREILEVAQPDPGRFPEFTPTVRRAMYDETCQFFLSVVQSNAPIGRLIDANYTYVNEELAKLYGIPGVSGPALRRVELPDRRRGGILTQGSILTLTSYPQRTSPVLRGKWVLSEVFGAPPPPPPPVVATLSPDDAPHDGQTLRQRLEKHREKPECKGCHARIDPLGFGLENYDAIGRWREKIGGGPVDAIGTLTTGESFNGVIELKKILLARQDEIARNLTERLLAYALGRGLEPADLPTVRRIVEAAKKDDYKTQTLIAQVVKSLPFRYRQSDPVHTAAAQ